MIRRPGLLDATLREVTRLDPTGGSLTLKMTGVSEATLTLYEDAPTVRMHDWISLYTRRGFVGVFRVTNAAQTYKKQIDLTLLHGIDILSDSVWQEQTTFSGSKAEFLRRMLAQQTHLIGGEKPWVLGDCEDTAQIEKDINYDKLSTLLEEMVEEGDDYYFTYDQTVFPWRLNCRKKDDEVTAEFRLARNVRSVTITYNDADLCTRLILSVNARKKDPKTGTEYTETSIRIYDNPEAQKKWGIVIKTADVDTHDDIEQKHFPSADAWAAAFLRKHAEPSVQIQIDGDELAEITGESWDEADLGRLCRAALPAYGQTFNERVVTLSYPELFKEETHATVSMANTLPKFSESIASASKTASRAASSARSAARGAASAKDLTTWSQHVKYYGEALDGTGVLTLYESGIDMDAAGGVKIFSLVEGVRALYAGITVNSGEIESLVKRTGVDELGMSETLYSRVSQTAEAINQEVVRASAAEGTLSSLIGQEADRIDLVVSGVGANASIRIWAIVDAINSSAVAIDADRIYLNGQVIASSISAVRADIRDLTTGVTKASLINSDAIYADSIGGATIAGGSVSIGSGTAGGSGTLYYRGVQYVRQAIVLGGAGGSIAEGHFLGESTAALNLDHYHRIVAEEENGKIVITLSEPLSTGDATGHITNFSIAATQAYKDGMVAAKASVQIKEAELNAVMGPMPASRTATYKTDASPPQSYAQTLYLTQGSWSGNKLTVSLRGGSSGGTVWAQTEVDASSVYNSGVAAGKAAVTLNEPTWNALSGAVGTSRTYTVKASNGESVSQSLYLTQGSWSSNKLTVSMRMGSTGGTVLASTQVDATSIYNAGYNAAPTYSQYGTTVYTIASSQYADFTLYTRSQNASGYVYTPIGTGYYRISRVNTTLYTRN